MPTQRRNRFRFRFCFVRKNQQKALSFSL